MYRKGFNLCGRLVYMPVLINVNINIDRSILFKHLMMLIRGSVPPCVLVMQVDLLKTACNSSFSSFVFMTGTSDVPYMLFQSVQLIKCIVCARF
jgi:hypothetical protein